MRSQGKEVGECAVLRNARAYADSFDTETFPIASPLPGFAVLPSRTLLKFFPLRRNSTMRCGSLRAHFSASHNNAEPSVFAPMRAPRHYAISVTPLVHQLSRGVAQVIIHFAYSLTILTFELVKGPFVVSIEALLLSHVIPLATAANF